MGRFCKNWSERSNIDDSLASRLFGERAMSRVNKNIFRIRVTLKYTTLKAISILLMAISILSSVRRCGKRDQYSTTVVCTGRIHTALYNYVAQ